MTDTNEKILSAVSTSPIEWAHRAGRLDAISDAHYAAARSIKGMERFPDKEKMAAQTVRSMDRGSEIAFSEKTTEAGLNTFVVLDAEALKLAPSLKDNKGGYCWVNDYRKAIKAKRDSVLPAGLKTTELTVDKAMAYDPKTGKLKTSDPMLHAAYVAIRNRTSVYCAGQWRKWKRHYEEAIAAAKDGKKKKGTRSASLTFRDWFFKMLGETAVDRAKTAAGRKTPDLTAPANEAAFAAFVKSVEKDFDALMDRLAGPQTETLKS